MLAAGHRGWLFVGGVEVVLLGGPAGVVDGVGDGAHVVVGHLCGVAAGVLACPGVEGLGDGGGELVEKPS